MGLRPWIGSEPIRTQDEPYPAGRMRSLAFTGMPVFIIAPYGKRWDVQSISIRCVTDATAVNRQFILKIDVPELQYPLYSEPFFTATQAYQTASQTHFYSWAKGVDSVNRSGTAYDGETAPLPNIILESRMSIQIGIENGQAGDVTTTIAHLYEYEAKP